MNHVMVRYTVHPDRVAENEALVSAVYRELAEAGPPDFHYSTFRLEDGVTFVHVAITSGGPAPLPGLAAFQRFTAGLSERCSQPPAFTPLTQLEAYRWPSQT